MSAHTTDDAPFVASDTLTTPVPSHTIYLTSSGRLSGQGLDAL